MVISWIVNPIRASTRISTVALVGRKLLSPASGGKNTPSYNYISHYSRPGVHRNIGEKYDNWNTCSFCRKMIHISFPKHCPQNKKIPKWDIHPPNPVWTFHPRKFQNKLYSKLPRNGIFMGY